MIRRKERSAALRIDQKMKRKLGVMRSRQCKKAEKGEEVIVKILNVSIFVCFVYNLVVFVGSFC